MVNLSAFIFPTIGFLLQTYTRLFNKSFGVDVWTRLLETRQVRNAGHKIPKRVNKRFLVPGNFDYPPVFPFILSFFKESTIEKYQGVVAPIFDALNNLFIYFVVIFFVGDVRVALLAQAIYTFTPVIALENSSLTPRSLGYLVMNLAFISTIVYLSTNSLLFLIASVLFTTLIFLTHRFATQSLLFLSIFFSLYTQEAYYLLVFVLGFGLATLLTGGYYLRVLKGHLANIGFWIPNRNMRFAHQIRGIQKERKKKDFVEFAYAMLSQFAPITMVATNFWILGAFAVAGMNLFTLPGLAFNVPEHITDFAVWVLFFYFLGIPILMISHLRCIGEGYRYLEMAALPTSVVSSWLFFQLLSTPYSAVSLSVYGTIFSVNILIIFSVHRNIIKDRNRSVTEEMKKAFAYLNGSKTTFNILCIPHQNTTNVLYHTKNHRVFVNADNPGLMKITDVYPVITKPLDTILKKNNINLIFLNEGFAKIKELKLANYKIVFKSGDFVLIKV